MESKTARKITVYTVGHSNHALADFLALLKEAGAAVIADVRSRPFSGYAPWFNRAELKRALEAAGFEYRFLGESLGGTPDDEAFYDDEGYVRYDRIASTEGFQDGVGTLLSLSAERAVVVLCGEEDPAECHRRLLVGRVLRERGAALVHIRGDGRFQSEEDVRRAEEAHGAGARQPSLFAREEIREWKSTRSVSRESRPGSSSKS